MNKNTIKLLIMAIAIICSCSCYGQPLTVYFIQPVPLAIVDNGPNDLNPANDIIDFNITVGNLQATGRCYNLLGVNSAALFLTDAVFKNNGPQTQYQILCITRNYIATPPLTWALYYKMNAQDLTGANINIPNHNVNMWIRTLGWQWLGQIVGPPFLNVPGPQNFTWLNGGFLGQTVYQHATFWTFSLGPNDQIELPNSIEAKVSTTDSVHNPITYDAPTLAPTDAPDLSTAPIPTLSEWGLIIFTLLLLSFGMVFVHRKQKANALIMAGYESQGIKPSLFELSLYFKALAGVLLLAIAGLVIAYRYFGTLSITDMLGTFVCSCIVAYIVQLWMLMKRK